MERPFRWPGLAGRAALVTGAGSGIGAACARLLAAGGARVAVAYHRRPPEATVAELAGLGEAPLAVQLDATDTASVRRALDEVGGWLAGPLHVLVNCAGGLHARARLEDMDDSAWSEVLELNLGSVFRVTRAALPFMTAGWGRIVNISSLSARDGGGPEASAYAAAKAGVEGLTRALAKELAGRGITVNAVAPGYVAGTPQVSSFVSPEQHREMVAANLVGRAGEPDDIAAMVVHLASDWGGYVSGAVVQVNGGRYLP